MKTMKKLSILLVFITLLTLTACGSEQKTIDIKKMSDDLLKNVKFSDELSLVDEKTVEKLYNINNAVNEAVYISSGATAEEIAIFEFKTKSDATDAKSKAEERISTQKESYASYIPEEVKKLDNAIIKKSGCYLVVCVSDGNAAANIIDKYIK